MLRPVPLVLLLLLAASAPAARAGSEPAARTLEGLRTGAVDLARGGEEDRAALLRWVAGGAPVARRAALEALSGEGVPLPPEALPAALATLASEDPVLRAAATGLLVRFGEKSLAPLERLAGGGTGDDLPAGVRPMHAATALEEVRRGEVERDFLSLWSSEDGSYHGMFDELSRHGATASRVLCAIALDRRIRGGEILPFGPYAWHHRPDSTRERSEVRHRAVDALGDVGDAHARALLTASLRRSGPADRLWDDTDQDPVPAAMDDAMRHTIAALGDTEPLRELLRALSRASGRRNSFWQIIQGPREASAHIQLGRVSEDPEEHHRELTQAYELLVSAADARRRGTTLANDSTDYYNLACVLAQRGAEGDMEQALTFLERSTEISPISSKWMLRDEDLASLRDQPRFRILVEAIRKVEAEQERE